MGATHANNAPQVVDYELSTELLAFRSQVRDYANTYLGKAAEWDAETAFPRSAIDAAAKLGLLRTTVSKAHGGSEMGNLASCVMLEEINAVCPSTGVTISVHNSLVNSLVGKSCSEDQRSRYFPSWSLANGSAPTACPRRSQAAMPRRCAATPSCRVTTT